MLTPQQIDEISFGRATFGGYDMQDVDDFLTPLTEDYVTLYKENALLKSKMRVLVGKLEEYRKNEAAMKEAVVNARRNCEKMVREAEAKAAQVLADAQAAANNVAVNTDALVGAEEARVEQARKEAAAKIDELQAQLHSCIQALERIKGANAPAEPAAPAAPAQPEAPAQEKDVADEIASNLEALVGTTDEPAPKPEPKHPTRDTTTSRFANLNLQFGRNYDPNHK